MVQEDFAASRLQQPATSPSQSQKEQELSGPFDILDAAPDFAVSDWLQFIIAVELGLIYLELNGGLNHG